MNNSSNTKIKLVVIDEHTLGYINPLLPEYAGVLRSLVAKGANFSVHNDPIHLGGNTIRLATAKDFDEYRVLFTGFEKDPNYEYQK
jgi:hypothetical protein